MKRRILIAAALAVLLSITSASAAGPKSKKGSMTGSWGWWMDGLTFWAPFDDVSNPLKLNKGTGSLSFTRATTATYVHPTTGLITSAASGQLRIEAQGALIEGARTNILLRSRTLNNAAWIATNVTVDNTITGEDGVANSASWVAASADNGTICQAVTIASAAFSGAFSLKRITGTGTVMISLDNGATYGSDVASSLSTSAWYRASKANQTLANPEICLKLGTSGDNVAVDYAQVESGAFISSRIPTTTAAVTRNADVLTFAIPSANISNSVGTFAATVTPSTSTTFLVASSFGLFYGVNSIRINDGTTVVSKTGALTLGTTYKLGWRWGGTEMAVTRDGLAPATGVFDGDMGFATSFRFGPTNETYGYAYIKNARIFNRSFTDTELQNITR